MEIKTTAENVNPLIIYASVIRILCDDEPEYKCSEWGTLNLDDTLYLYDGRYHFSEAGWDGALIRECSPNAPAIIYTRNFGAERLAIDLEENALKDLLKEMGVRESKEEEVE